ncbi:MAG TPA: hypothetical protein ENN68_05085 [Methanomicrobia archaeon]|nr:hypothetical protein [Methanomicrobia archaeon]
MAEDEAVLKTPGFAWRVSLSIVVVMGWLAFLILWVTFYAAAFTLIENSVIVLVSLLIVGAILGASWASWGIKYGRTCGRQK